jgi:hypothetical protein
MTDKPKETHAPGIEWGKDQTLLQIPGTEMQFLPPDPNEVNCGPCAFNAKVYDAEVLERMFRDHNCDRYPFDPDPPELHQSVSEVAKTMLHWAGALILIYMVAVAVDLLPWLWTN